MRCGGPQRVPHQNADLQLVESIASSDAVLVQSQRRVRTREGLDDILLSSDLTDLELIGIFVVVVVVVFVLGDNALPSTVVRAFDLGDGTAAWCPMQTSAATVTTKKLLNICLSGENGLSQIDTNTKVHDG